MHSPESIGYPIPAEVERQLLINTQHFLRECLEGRAPDAYLTHQWEEFYRVYAAFLKQLAVRYRLDTQETEDLLQEVWLQVYRHLPELNGPQRPLSLRAWLFTLIKRRALNFLRSRHRRPQRLSPEQARAIVASARRGSAEADRELLHAVLDEMKAELSVDQHHLLMLRLIEGWTPGRIAQELKLTAGQFRDRQKYLLRKLRRRLAVYEGRSLQPS